MAVFLLEEDRALKLLDRHFVFDAVSAALVAAADGSGHVNPVVIGTGLAFGQTFSLKSGRATGDKIVGLKVGSYWPGAENHGLPRHGSTILLLDASSGRMRAIVEASRLNGPRTAAADAVAAAQLARRDATTLAIIGAGHQARYEVAAICDVLPINRILIVARTPSRAIAFCEEVGPLLPDTVTISPASAEDACRAADVVVTVTPSRAPLFDADWIKPGTHVASMGSDQVGKQELPRALLTRGRLFCDLPSQSLAIGEFQRVRGHIESGALSLTAIGDVLRGVAQARTSTDEITVFDSSGLALQDLFLAESLVRAALASD